MQDRANESCTLEAEQCKLKKKGSDPIAVSSVAMTAAPGSVTGPCRRIPTQLPLAIETCIRNVATILPCTSLHNGAHTVPPLGVKGFVQAFKKNAPLDSGPFCANRKNFVNDKDAEQTWRYL